MVQAGTTIIVSWASIHALTFMVSFSGGGIPSSVTHTAQTRLMFYGITSNVPYRVRVVPINSKCRGDGMIMTINLSGMHIYIL